MSRMIRYAKSRGFTLVELLIVVAIIGILATVGVPTYRRMVQKSKKSEAKVALGGLYSAEVGFFSEYGAYGSQIDHVGFEIDGNPKYYSVGFGSATCTDIAARPTKATTTGAAINAIFPGYYTSGNNSIETVAGQADCVNTVAALFPTTGNNFTGSATGLIRTGMTLGAAALTDMDIWQIDQNRKLWNSQDGVN